MTIIETSTQTISAESEPNSQTVNQDYDDDVISLGSISQSSASASSELAHQQRNNSRDQLSSLGYPFYHGADESKSSNEIKSSRAQSINSLPQRPLRETITGDSGTGASITNPPHRSSLSSIPHEETGAHGYEGKAYMLNRFDFDRSKVMSHKIRQRSTHSNTAPAATGLTHSYETKKTNSIFAIFLGKKSSTSSASLPPTPLMRHHSSRTTGDENQ